MSACLLASVQRHVIIHIAATHWLIRIPQRIWSEATEETRNDPTAEIFNSFHVAATESILTIEPTKKHGRSLESGCLAIYDEWSVDACLWCNEQTCMTCMNFTNRLSRSLPSALVRNRRVSMRSLLNLSCGFFFCTCDSATNDSDRQSWTCFSWPNIVSPFAKYVRARWVGGLQ